MKTETHKAESMVEELRKIRDQIGLEIQDLNPEQVLEYFNKQKGLLPKSYWNKADDLKPENK
jgi:hypothetical protein